MGVDVRPDHMVIVKNILRSLAPAYRIVAFGSRVKGTANSTSDLDLCIMSDERISFSTMAELRDAFSLSNLPYKVDVIDWSVVSPDFKELIVKNCFEVQTHRVRKF